jgi:DNA repair exonuclease SbcCD ATPase subunit
MIPLHLSLTDFGPYRSEQVDLSGISLAALVGTNGAGKSTLLDAIRVALYGRAVAPLDGFIRQGSAGFKVDFTFTLNTGSRYRVVREHGKAQKAVLYLEGLPVAEGVVNVDSHIENELLRCDYQTFSLAHWLRQGELGRFSAMQPAERKKWLASVLPMDEIRDLETAAKTKAADLKALGDKIGYSLSAADPRNEIDSARVRLTDALAWHEAAQEVVREATRKLGEETATARAQEQSIRKLEDARVGLVNTALVASEAAARLSQQETRVRDLEALTSGPPVKTRPVDEIEADLENGREAAEAAAVADRAGHAHDEALRALQRATDALEAVASDSAVCPTCGQTMTEDACATAREGLSAAVREAQAVVDAAAAEYRVACGAVSAPYNMGGLRDELTRAKLEERKSIEREANRQQLAEYRERLVADREASKRAEERLVLAQAVVDDMLAVTIDDSDVAGAERRLEELRAEQSQAALNAGIRQTQLQALEDLIAAEDEARAELNQIHEDITDAEILKAAYGKNGIQARMMTEAVSFIESECNTFLGRFSSGLSIQLTMTKQTKSGDLRDTLDILVSDAFGVRAIDTFSGGERTRVNFALSVAIGRLLSSQHDTRVASFVVDEPEYLDAGGVEELAACLQTLSMTVPFVVLVSHIGGVVEQMPQRLEVRKSDAGSRVAVEA